jgi:hypothetical protein
MRSIERGISNLKKGAPIFGEYIYAASTFLMSSALAHFVIEDVHRNDYGNAAVEAVGAIFSITLSYISGKKFLKDFRENYLPKKANLQ